jgi:hypothetical protein
MKTTTPRISTVLALIALIAPLLFVAYMGSFTRFHADDFCAIGLMKSAGFWEALQYWYQSWNGRFAFTFFSQIFGLGGVILARLLPGILGAVWLAGLGKIFNSILQSLRKGRLGEQANRRETKPAWEGSLLAAGSIFLVLYTIPNLFQSFLWESGLINYTLPLVLITLLVAGALSFRIKNDPVRGLEPRLLLFTVLLFSLAVISAGFSETHSVTQIALLFSWIIILAVQSRTRPQTYLLVLLCVICAGTLTGFAITALAPGNTNRIATINPQGNQTSIVELASLAGQYAYITIHAFVKHHWAKLSIILAVAAWTGWSLSKGFEPLKAKNAIQTWIRSQWLYLYLALPLVCFGFVSLAMLPAAYVLNSYPDSRALILHHAIITFCAVVFGVCTGMAAGRLRNDFPVRLEQIVLGLVLLGLAVSAYTSMANLAQTVPERREFASRWDTRDVNLRQALANGEENALAAGLEQYFGLHDLAYESSNWINVCMAQYYGFTSVSGR